ncbi:hypothetical protein ACFO9Q_10860 [Paenibacillus sp. GCM10023252]|uniref:hypothetical protein n=1 Tax=Paenibacillus sp. GCM10023252 TaxID=3252649 RepID=UPI00360B7168
MRKTILFLNIVLLLLAVLTSCSNDINKTIQGDWIAESADQKVGTTDFLNKYNYVNIQEEEMNFRLYSREQLDDKTLRVLSSTNEKVKYDLNKNSITINDSHYQIEIQQDEMIIKNDNIEILYIRE